jgi:hypothetical protein
MFGYIGPTLVLVSAIWVYMDAKKLGIRKGLMPGLFDMGPQLWAVGTFFLWILFFPFYLVKRKDLHALAAKAGPGK